MEKSADKTQLEQIDVNVTIEEYQPEGVNCYVVATGNPFDGLTLTGPFGDFPEALEYADGINDMTWWIIPVWNQ